MKKALLIGVTLTTASLALTACGGSQPAKQEATTAAAVEETTKAVDPIVGRWKMIKMTDGENETEVPEGSYCTFEEDGSMTMADNDEARSGTWKEAAPGTYLAVIDGKDETFIIDGDTLTFKGDPVSFIFTRE